MVNTDLASDPDGYLAGLADRARRPLEVWVSELVEREIESQGRDAIAYRRVNIIERQLLPGSQPDADPVRLEDFEQRWSEIMRSVCRDWVNLSALGIDDDGTLTLVVEWFGASERYNTPCWPYVHVMTTSLLSISKPGDAADDR